MNKVTLCQARLVLRWVTIGWWVNHLAMQPVTQVNQPLLVGAVSTSQSWGSNRHTTHCTSLVSVVTQCKLVSGWLRKWRSVSA